MKRALMVCILLMTASSMSYAHDWEFDGLLIDMELGQSNGWGFHGAAVDPDGNIWLALHGNLAEDTLFVGSDTINVRPIYVLDPNGNHVSFSPIRWIEFSDGSRDTLDAASPINGSGKGISIDNDGNILYTSWSTVYRIDYQTGLGLDSYTPDDKASMTEAVQDTNGLIYVGYVGSKSRPVLILDDNFNYVGNAIDTLGHTNRTLAVSPDGQDLYVGSTWSGFGIVHYNSPIPGVLQYSVVDTFGNWDSVYVADEDTTYYDVKLWASSLDWGPDGNLWAGNLRPDWSGPMGGRYYAYDPETEEIVDSVGIAMGDSSAGGVYSPRGATWSADGNTMYLADYDYNVISIWTNVDVGVEAGPRTTPRSFTLGQNYPNPFNPTTIIPFDISKGGVVMLAVYNIIGQEVSRLLDKPMEAGHYEIPFDGSGMASGVYYYRLTLDGRELAKRMVLVK